jgi:hypothetical protein
MDKFFFQSSSTFYSITLTYVPQIFFFFICTDGQRDDEQHGEPEGDEQEHTKKSNQLPKRAIHPIR